MAIQYQQPANASQPMHSRQYDALSASMTSMSLSGPPATSSAGQPAAYGQQQQYSQYPPPSSSYYGQSQGQGNGAPVSALVPHGVAYPVSSPSNAAPVPQGAGYPAGQYPHGVAYPVSSPKPDPQRHELSPSLRYPQSGTSGGSPSQYSSAVSPLATPATPYQYPNQHVSAASAQSVPASAPAPASSLPSAYQYPPGYMTPSVTPPASAAIQSGYPAPVPQMPQQQAQVAASGPGIANSSQPAYQYAQRKFLDHS
jgi:hypothetical protein